MARPAAASGRLSAARWQSIWTTFRLIVFLGPVPPRYQNRESHSSFEITTQRKCRGNVKIEMGSFQDAIQLAALTGKQWGRDDDTFGIAGVINGISGVHQAYLNAGGLGILVGDGQLSNPGSEKIIETYYSFPVFAAKVTLDYKLIVNPAYNRDRGPASVLVLCEFIRSIKLFKLSAIAAIKFQSLATCLVHWRPV
jgi:hypothetical protein